MQIHLISSSARRCLALILALSLSLGPTLGAISTAAAQSAPAGLMESLRDLPRGSGGAEDPIEVGPADWALEQPVDPDLYRVLPGDLVHVGAWGEGARAFTLRVGPEGALLVPDVGPIQVAGLSLREAQSRLVEAFRPLYPRSSVSLRLLEPGRFRVPVTGLVERPGVYETSSLDRVSSLLEQAGGIRPGGSVRRLRLAPLDHDGPTEEIDLARWLLGGELAANPFLASGLALEIPPIGPTVRVRGPVQGRAAFQTTPVTPARFADRPEEEPDLRVEWLPGDSVATILGLAGGASDRATGVVTLRRAGEDARLLSLARAADRAQPVAPGDILELEYAARWVYLTGAVRMPGRYPHLPGMRVGDYVSLAGGPTELGRSDGWTIRRGDESAHAVEPSAFVDAGSTLRVPERRTYKFNTLLAPLSSASALIISIIALSRR